MKKLSSLSVFFPAYNDEKNISSVVKNVFTVLPTVATKYEVIVINDGSKDKTSDVLKSLAKQYKNFRIITHKKNRGYGGALISGFKASCYDWVFYTDGDGQYDPKELIKLVNNVNDTDVVNGYKLSRADGFIRLFLGKLNNFFLHLLFPAPISDIDCDFRLIKNDFLKDISLHSNSGTICIELVMKLKKQGATFAEVGVHHYNRSHGSSTFLNIPNVLKTIYDNITFFFSYHFGNK